MMSLHAIEDKTAVVVVALYRSVSRNPVRFKALVQPFGDLEEKHVPFLNQLNQDQKEVA